METPDLKVLVTGGTGGIGSATARLLAAGGASVAIADLDLHRGQQLAHEIGPAVTALALDVTDAAAWDQTVAQAEEELGGLNALFNNAGIATYGTTADCAPDAFRRTIDVNLTGVFLGMRAVTPALRRAGGGVIVNTSSTAGMLGYPNLIAYVASKWAVRGMTKAAALDLGPDGIRVVSVHPGPVRTPMTEGLSDSAVAGLPLPRLGQPEEVARLVRFLMTEATWSTGSEFLIDGGESIGKPVAKPG